ncbi:MAG: hypothetical protein AAFX06_18470 [Planctomycetota bacterium]
MNSLYTLTLVTLAVGATLLGASYEGRLSHRWSSEHQTKRLTAAIKTLPESLNGWEKVSSQPVNATAQSVLHCFASDVSRFRHQETGRQIEAAVLVGPSGPISVHTPDICYSSREYKSLGQRVRVGGGADQYWAIDFQGRGIAGGYLRSIYAWSDSERWEAPDSSRLRYAGKPFLVKVQFAVTGTTADSVQTPEVLEFVEAYCDEVANQIQLASR